VRLWAKIDQFRRSSLTAHVGQATAAFPVKRKTRPDGSWDGLMACLASSLGIHSSSLDHNQGGAAVTYSLHRALAAVGVLVLSAIIPGCSGLSREAGAVGTSAVGPAAIGIATSQFSVTIENRAGVPLLDLQVVITPI